MIKALLYGFASFLLVFAVIASVEGFARMGARPRPALAKRVVVPPRRSNCCVRSVPPAPIETFTGTLADKVQTAPAEQAAGINEAQPSTSVSTAKSPAGAGCLCGEACKCLNKSICDDGNCKSPYVVAFSTNGCAPCLRMKPVYAEVRARGFPVYELHSSIHKGATAAVNPRVFPCLIIHGPGGAIERVEGTASVEYLVERLSHD